MPLRRAIAEEVAGTRGIPVGPENVVIVPGGKPIIFFTILALVNPGDEVVYPNPGFRVYESLINFVGGTPVPLPLREEREFSFDPDEFKSLVGPCTKLIILNLPGNPCGGVFSESDLKAVASAAREHDCYVLSDEIYSRILYDGQHHTIAALPGMQERTVILDGFSQSYARTGRRLGYGVMRDDLAGWITRLMVNSNSCAAAFTQMAGLAALNGDPGEVRRMVAELRRNRDAIVLGLERHPRRPLLQPAWGDLRLPQRPRAGPELAGTGRPPDARGRGRDPSGHRLRHVGRRVSPHFLRDLGRKHPARRQAHPGVRFVNPSTTH